MACESNAGHLRFRTRRADKTTAVVLGRLEPNTTAVEPVETEGYCRVAGSKPGGSSTLSTAWMTPLEASTSAMVTFAGVPVLSVTVTPDPLTPSVKGLP